MLTHGHSTTTTQKATEAAVGVCGCVCKRGQCISDELTFNKRLTGEESLIVTQIQVSTETLGSNPYYCDSTIKGTFKLQSLLLFSSRQEETSRKMCSQTLYEKDDSAFCSLNQN